MKYSREIFSTFLASSLIFSSYRLASRTVGGWSSNPKKLSQWANRQSRQRARSSPYGILALTSQMHEPVEFYVSNVEHVPQCYCWKFYYYTFFLIIFAQAIFEETVKYKSCYDIASWGSLLDEQKKREYWTVTNWTSWTNLIRTFVHSVTEKFFLKKHTKRSKKFNFLKYWINSV